MTISLLIVSDRLTIPAHTAPGEIAFVFGLFRTVMKNKIQNSLSYCHPGIFSFTWQWYGYVKLPYLRSNTSSHWNMFYSNGVTNIYIPKCFKWKLPFCFILSAFNFGIFKSGTIIANDFSVFVCGESLISLILPPVKKTYLFSWDLLIGLMREKLF